MHRPPQRKKSGTPYWVRFSLVMLGFGGFTSTFVLVVLPRRFVLQSGLVESGITFETEDLPFRPPEPLADIRPTQSSTASVDAAAGVGPAEQLWRDVLPLLEDQRFNTAVPIFREYLLRFPNDISVQREYAVTLERAERFSDAENAYRALEEAGDGEARLALARLLRDRGENGEAIMLLRQILAEYPDSTLIHLELARTQLWAERYDDAASTYRGLVREREIAPAVRLELAQALYWGGGVEEPFGLLSGYPSHDSGWAAASQLLNEIVPQITLPARGRPELIREAIARGDHASASKLFGELLARSPRDSPYFDEWLNFLQYEAVDLEAARQALLSREETHHLNSDQSFRLAQLHAWTGNEDLSKVELCALLEREPNRAAAWALLGDLQRWDGELREARESYNRSLSLAPDNLEARTGLTEIQAQVDLIIADRDRIGIGPEVTGFRDSDDFNRLDIAARATTLWHASVFSIRAGYRYLDGPGSAGAIGVEDGVFAELEVIRWWRLGTVRTSVLAGVQQFQSVNAEPTLNATLELPDAGGTALRMSYAHGPAYPHTATLTSLLGGIRSDDFQLSAFRSLNDRWTVAGNASVVSLSGRGGNNVRIGGAASVTHDVSGFVCAGLSSRVLTHTDASPYLEDRRLYWDPNAFWTNSVLLEFRLPDNNGWSAFGRVTPGLALAQERGSLGTQFAPQLGTEAGFSYETGRVLMESDFGYYRGRAGDYHSMAGNFRLSVRP